MIFLAYGGNLLARIVNVRDTFFFEKLWKFAHIFGVSGGNDTIIACFDSVQPVCVTRSVHGGGAKTVDQIAFGIGNRMTASRQFLFKRSHTVKIDLQGLQLLFI